MQSRTTQLAASPEPDGLRTTQQLLEARAAESHTGRPSAPRSDGNLGAARTRGGTRGDHGEANGTIAVFVVAGMLVALFVVSCGKGLTWPETLTPNPTPGSTAPTQTGATGGSVSAWRLRGQLARVDIAERSPAGEAYDRAEFGPDWTDEHNGVGGHNSCDTRNDVLARDLRNVALDPGSECEVASGVLRDPYTGRRIDFDAAADPNAVQVEHIYPLSLAWQRGAYAWSEQQRVDFANDIQRNLIAVDGPTNMSKGDDSPAEWLPPNDAYQCEYLYRFLKVAAHYDLPITDSDAAVVEQQATQCGAGGGRRG